MKNTENILPQACKKLIYMYRLVNLSI